MDKPSLNLEPGDLTNDEVVAMFKEVAGRDPTAEELAELEAESASPKSGAEVQFIDGEANAPDGLYEAASKAAHDPRFWEQR